MRKKLTKNSKKGFTIVELVVVIAVIGILTAVMIPTFSGVIKKAERTVATEEASSYIVAYQSWLIEKDQLGYTGEPEYFVTSDTNYNSSKSYYKIVDNEYVVVEEFAHSEAVQGLYYEKTEGKSFRNYCSEQFGLETTENVEIIGTSDNSTGFKYVSNSNKYLVTYTKSDGKITVEEQ